MKLDGLKPGKFNVHLFSPGFSPEKVRSSEQVRDPEQVRSPIVEYCISSFKGCI